MIKILYAIGLILLVMDISEESGTLPTEYLSKILLMQMYDHDANQGPDLLSCGFSFRLREVSPEYFENNKDYTKLSCRENEMWKIESCADTAKLFEQKWPDPTPNNVNPESCRYFSYIKYVCDDLKGNFEKVISKYEMFWVYCAASSAMCKNITLMAKDIQENIKANPDACEFLTFWVLKCYDNSAARQEMDKSSLTQACLLTHLAGPGLPCYWWNTKFHSVNIWSDVGDHVCQEAKLSDNWHYCVDKKDQDYVHTLDKLYTAAIWCLPKSLDQACAHKSQQLEKDMANSYPKTRFCKEYEVLEKKCSGKNLSLEKFFKRFKDLYDTCTIISAKARCREMAQELADMKKNGKLEATDGTCAVQNECVGHQAIKELNMGENCASVTLPRQCNVFMKDFPIDDDDDNINSDLCTSYIYAKLMCSRDVKSQQIFENMKLLHDKCEIREVTFTTENSALQQYASEFLIIYYWTFALRAFGFLSYL